MILQLEDELLGFVPQIVPGIDPNLAQAIKVEADKQAAKKLQQEKLLWAGAGVFGGLLLAAAFVAFRNSEDDEPPVQQPSNQPTQVVAPAQPVTMQPNLAGKKAA